MNDQSYYNTKGGDPIRFTRRYAPGIHRLYE
jgi:hypothetical protein